MDGQGRLCWVGDRYLHVGTVERTLKIVDWSILSDKKLALVVPVRFDGNEFRQWF